MLKNIEINCHSSIKITNETIIVAPKTVKALSKTKNVILVEPNNTYKVEGIKIETISTHYGSIVGIKEDGIEFKRLINPEIECMILIK